MTISSSGAGGIVGALALGALMTAMSGTAAGQCGAHWLPETPEQAVTGSLIAGMTMWDSDGAGPLGAKVVAVGSFTTAGGVAAKNIACWDGANWEQIGGGTNGFIVSVATLSDGRLVIAGNFTLAGNVPVAHIAIWDGVQWSGLGEGLSGTPAGPINFQVNALAADANGGVYAAGAFTTAGTTPVTNIAYWDGTTWSALGSGLSGFGAGQPWVSDLLLLPSGELLASGAFSDAGGTAVKSIAKWDGTSWSNIAGGGVDGAAWCMERAPSGSIYVGGSFGVLTGPFQSGSNIAEWNGTKWNKLGSGVAGSSGIGGSVRDIAILENGDLIVGGSLTVAGGSPASSIARWDGAAWSPLGAGIPSAVHTMLVHPSGELLVGRDATSSSNKTKVFSRWVSGTCCVGDLDLNGEVNDSDFELFVVAYNILDCADPAMPAGCPADVNGDALVDDADFTLFVVAYNALICS
ncbi:MAG: hypothetical protein JNM86_08675 [Phycisphaerae bacterium]|nr:hypothetical protein [Phycisphaerae bacterium]